MKLTNIIALLTIISVTSKILTATTKKVQPSSWLSEPAEVKCFCGRRIRGDASLQLNFIKSKTLNYSSSLINSYKDKYNQVVKNTNSNFPEISDFEIAVVTTSNPKERIKQVMTRYKASFDFLTLYFYYGKYPNNFRFDFQIEPKKTDPDFLPIREKKYEKNLGSLQKYLKDNKYKAYSYLYPGLKNFMEAAGVTSVDNIGYSRQLSHDLGNNYETDLCKTFFIFMNKVVTMWKSHYGNLKKKKTRPGNEYSNLKTMIFTNLQSGVLENVCLRDQEIRITTFEAPKKYTEDLESENFEEKQEILRTIRKHPINLQSLRPKKKLAASPYKKSVLKKSEKLQKNTRIAPIEKKQVEILDLEDSEITIKKSIIKKKDIAHISLFFDTEEDIQTFEINQKENELIQKNKNIKVPQQEFDDLELLKSQKLEEIKNKENTQKNLYEGLYEENQNFIEENGYKIFVKEGEFELLENFVDEMKKDGLTDVGEKMNYQILKIIDLENFYDSSLDFNGSDILHFGAGSFSTNFNFEDIQGEDENEISDLRISIESYFKQTYFRDYFLMFLILEEAEFYLIFQNDKELQIWLDSSSDLNSKGPANRKISWNYKKSIEEYLSEKSKNNREKKYLQIQTKINTLKIRTNFESETLEQIQSLNNQEFLNFINTQRQQYLRRQELIIALLKLLSEDEDQKLLSELISNFTQVKNQAIRIGSTIQFTSLKIIIYNDFTIRTNFPFLHNLLIKLFYTKQFIYYKEIFVKEFEYEYLEEETVVVEKAKSVSYSLELNPEDFSVVSIQFSNFDPESNVDEEKLKSDVLGAINSLLVQEGVPEEEEVRMKKIQEWMANLMRRVI